MKKALYLLITVIIIAVSALLVSCTTDAPYIGENGNWWVGGTDLGVQAQGPQGEPGEPGEQGAPGEKGEDGKNGVDGSSITVVSVIKSKTEGLVDTYSIYFSNGKISQFTVTNGSAGEKIAVTSIEKSSSQGLVDIYKITFNDNTVQYFSVTNGEDGLTPYVGENGNWWTGEEDTGIPATSEKDKETELTFYSSGLEYKTATIFGKSGFIVTGWSDFDLDDDYAYSFTQYTSEELEYLYSDIGFKNGHLVIPDYIGSVPVIGVAENAYLNFGKVTLSKNCVYLGTKAFYNCSNLSEIDFNDAMIKYIPSNCFTGTSLQTVDLPSSVTHLFDYAFKDVNLLDFDFKNITYVGTSALSGLIGSVYLPKTIEYVGSDAFSRCFVYLEHETIPDDWGTKISLIDNKYLALNCSVSNLYIYGKDGQTATVYKYLGHQNAITMPATIDGTTVTKIGYGFANKMSEEEKIDTPSYLKLPASIKYIDIYTFNYSETFVSIPSSIECVSAKSGYLAYYAFEAADLPSICESWIGDSDGYSLTPTQYRSEVRGVRFSLNNDPSTIEYDEAVKKFYKKDIYGYSLIAVMGQLNKDLTIESHFNGDKVYTICADALGGMCLIVEEDGYIDIGYNKLSTLQIESGITKLQTNSIGCQVNKVFIPKSITTINAYAFKNASVFYVEASSKPDEWDTYWANSYQNIYYGVKNLFSKYGFEYIVNQNDEIELLKYNLHSDLYIPRTLDGLPIVKICSNFYTEAGCMTVYIPSSIKTIENEAFYISSGNNYSFFYIEASSKPDGWVNNWAISNNYNIHYQYNSAVPNVYFEGDFAYIDSSETTVKLVSYIGNKTSIVVPRTINGKTVTEIDKYTFCFDYGYSYTIFIPTTITYLSNYTFYLYSGNSCHIYYEGTSSQLGVASYYCVVRNGSSCGTITYEYYPLEN